MDDQHKTLHIAMFPWLAFGHIIPYLELAKLIAQRGHKISFISTPGNIKRLPKIPSNLAPKINLVSLTLPQVQNLPNNAEATMDLPFDKIPYLKLAFDGLQHSLAQFLQSSTPDWILYDFAPYWLPSIAAKLGISQAFFSIFQAWTITFLASSSSALINGDDSRTEAVHFTVPPKWIPFPSKVVYRLHEARRIPDHFEVNNSGFSDGFRLGTVMAGCDVIAIRSCFELEADFLMLANKLYGKPAVPIGILPRRPSLGGDGGDSDDEAWITICSWLNKQDKRSVVYVALGSELTLTQQEVTELALGLELSGLPFFWALRKSHVSAESDSVELPDGFEERVKGRGLVWTSWAPQPKIMAHESVGGFLTHCGFSSVTEALYFGRPLILLPFSLDQGLIARVFEEKKVGVEVPRDEKDGLYSRDSVAESLKLVVVDEGGVVYRENAKQMRTLFADNDLHDRYVDHFVEILQNHRLARKD